MAVRSVLITWCVSYVFDAARFSDASQKLLVAISSCADNGRLPSRVVLLDWRAPSTFSSCPPPPDPQRQTHTVELRAGRSVPAARGCIGEDLSRLYSTRGGELAAGRWHRGMPESLPRTYLRRCEHDRARAHAPAGWQPPDMYCYFYGCL